MTDHPSRIDIFINGEKIKTTQGRSILKTARDNDIDIPHLCFHPALKPSGSCRLCGVEVVSPTGRQVVMLSCVLKAKQGLEINTHSGMVREHLEKSFDRLLKMAPDSTRIRELADRYSIPVPASPDGCIRCRLCIRVCSEIVRAKALKMVKTPAGSRVTAEPGRCIGCGTCANLCPTKIIRVTDQDCVRTVSLKEEIIGKLPLERCEVCGKMYATANFLKHVEESTLQHPDTKEHHHLCPSCIKLMSNRAITERERLKK